MNAFSIRMSVFLQCMRISVFRNAGTGDNEKPAARVAVMIPGIPFRTVTYLNKSSRDSALTGCNRAAGVNPYFYLMNKHIKSFWLLPLAGMTLSFMPSCTTDSYGNSSVTPGGAAAIGVGALAAGAAIGAAVQHDRDKDRYRNDWRHHNPPPPPPRPPHRPQWRR